MPKFYTVKVDIDGRLCEGTWRIQQGWMVRVACFWGADVCHIGKLKPEEAAAKLLSQIVRARHKADAEVRKRQERELARVNRYWDRKKKPDDGSSHP